MRIENEIKPESIFEQFSTSIQKLMNYKCSCGQELHRMCTFHLKFDIFNCNRLTKKGKDISSHRYKLYYKCDELSGMDRYIGDPTGIGYKTIEEAAEELKRYLENDR